MTVAQQLDGAAVVGSARVVRFELRYFAHVIRCDVEQLITVREPLKAQTAEAAQVEVRRTWGLIYRATRPIGVNCVSGPELVAVFDCKLGGG